MCYQKMWKDKIINSPDLVSEHYRSLWTDLNRDSNIERKKIFFTEIREKYNVEHNPLDFMFIMRTAVNGMPRYNRNGDFNTSLHITRNGILPDKLDKIVHEWSKLLREKDVRFLSCSYENIKTNSKDFMYLDPPYANAMSMYYGTIDYKKLWNYLRECKCGYILSFDGISGKEDNSRDVPKDIYSYHKYILNGNSSFKRTVGKSNDSVVFESLYVR